MSSRNAGPGNNVAKVVTFDSTQQQVAVYTKKDPNEGRTGDPVKDLEAKLTYITEAVPLNGRPIERHPEGSATLRRDSNTSGSTAGAGSGDFHQYRSARRREHIRLAAMHAEDKANEEQEAFEERQFERETVEETLHGAERTEKKRNKRQLKKERQRASKSAKEGDGGGPGGGGGGDGGGGGSDGHEDDRAEGKDFEALD